MVKEKIVWKPKLIIFNYKYEIANTHYASAAISGQVLWSAVVTNRL